jgi:hypothetical protein
MPGSAGKFGSKQKSRTFALPFEKRVVEKARSSYRRLTLEEKVEKFCKKIWRLKNKAYLCIPVRKTGPRERI